MSKKITLEDLGLSPTEMETFARGARHLFGNADEKSKPDESLPGGGKPTRKDQDPKEGVRRAS